MVERQTTLDGFATPIAVVTAAIMVLASGKPGVGSKIGGNHYQYAVHAAESGGQRRSILHIGKGDLAAALLPGGAFGGVAHDGANGQAGIQQSARGGAADLAGNSSHCKHVVSYLRRRVLPGSGS